VLTLVCKFSKKLAEALENLQGNGVKPLLRNNIKTHLVSLSRLCISTNLLNLYSANAAAVKLDFVQA
jgi:hypothetical protein